MHRALAAVLALVLLACTDSGGSVGALHAGYWEAESHFGEPWACGTPTGAACAAPLPFVPLPPDVRIGAGGIVEWSPDIVHRGVGRGLCIDVPAASEHGHARDAYAFCLAVGGDGEPIEERAGVIIAWDQDDPDDACACGAAFLFVGP